MHGNAALILKAEHSNCYGQNSTVQHEIIILACKIAIRQNHKIQENKMAS